MSDSKLYPKMVFKAYTDNTFTKRRKSKSGEALEYTVLINPTTMDRSFSPMTTKSKHARSSNSSGGDGGLNPETYKFDLYFDGTGVAGEAMPGAKLAENFQSFLDTVYAYSGDSSKKMKANFVVMCFGSLEFTCKLSSLSANYLLFNRDGTPLRIKASCTFSSVKKEKPSEKKDDKGGAGPEPEPPLPQEPDNCHYVYVCPGDTPEDNAAKAKENDSPSLLTANRKPEDMKQKEKPAETELLYTPAY
jgi:hypothetical protein